jgi:hypothetical protein
VLAGGTMSLAKVYFHTSSMDVKLQTFHSYLPVEHGGIQPFESQ